MKIIKEIQELQSRLRNDYVTRVDDDVIIDVLEVLQNASEYIEESKGGSE